MFCIWLARIVYEARKFYRAGRSPIINRKCLHTSPGSRAFTRNATFILLSVLAAFACNSASAFSGRTSERQGAASLREAFRARCRMPAFGKRHARFIGGAGLSSAPQSP